MDLSTTYLGLDLAHPFMPGASPLVDDLDTVRRLEDCGAAAIVMHSLFEEQLGGEAGLSVTAADEVSLGPEEYLEQLVRIQHAVDVPVIASLNGISWGGWLEYARLIEQAGADALELNTYQLATDPERDGESIEAETLAMVGELASNLKIPIAVKLSPFYTSLAHFARRLVEVEADGLVLFNRFYQADIDLENFDAKRSLHLSHSSELLLRLRWLAILSGQIETSFAVTGGVHSSSDAVKAILAGADAVQVVSLLLRHGCESLGKLRRGVENWLEANEYESLDQARGSMNLAKTPNPSVYERANYLHILQSWKGHLPSRSTLKKR